LGVSGPPYPALHRCYVYTLLSSCANYVVLVSVLSTPNDLCEAITAPVTGRTYAGKGTSASRQAQNRDIYRKTRLLLALCWCDLGGYPRMVAHFPCIPIEPEYWHHYPLPESHRFDCCFEKSQVIKPVSSCHLPALLHPSLSLRASGVYALCGRPASVGACGHLPRLKGLCQARFFQTA
jgi:hypothetical protein